MKVYKILHKPTGLFFRPTKSSGSNLSKDGKIYNKRPNINSYIGNGTNVTLIHIKIYSRSGKLNAVNRFLIEYFQINNIGGYEKGRWWDNNKIDIREDYVNINITVEVPITDWEIVEYEIK